MTRTPSAASLFNVSSLRAALLGRTNDEVWNAHIITSLVTDPRPKVSRTGFLKSRQCERSGVCSGEGDLRARRIDAADLIYFQVFRLGAAIQPPATGMYRHSGHSFGTSVKLEPLPVATARKVLGTSRSLPSGNLTFTGIDAPPKTRVTTQMTVNRFYRAGPMKTKAARPFRPPSHRLARLERHGKHLARAKPLLPISVPAEGGMKVFDRAFGCTWSIDSR